MCVTVQLSDQKENNDIMKKKTEDEFIFSNAYQLNGEIVDMDA